MSQMFYGAVRLDGDFSDQSTAVMDYWQPMATMHQFWIEPGAPSRESLDQDFLELWKDESWLLFRLGGTAAKHTADGLLLECSRAVTRLPQWSRNAEENRYLWMRVPQWRGLWCILSHEAIIDAYLVVDDATGDTADPAEAIRATLFETLDSIWMDYVMDYTEDAHIYHVDLAPRSMNWTDR